MAVTKDYYDQNSAYEPAIAKTPLPRSYIKSEKDALFERMRNMLVQTSYRAPDVEWAAKRDALLKDITTYMNQGM